MTFDLYERAYFEMSEATLGDRIVIVPCTEDGPLTASVGGSEYIYSVPGGDEVLLDAVARRFGGEYEFRQHTTLIGLGESLGIYRVRGVLLATGGVK